MLGDRSETLKEGEGQWEKSELRGRKEGKAHKREIRALTAADLSKTESIDSLYASF